MQGVGGFALCPECVTLTPWHCSQGSSFSVQIKFDIPKTLMVDTLSSGVTCGTCTTGTSVKYFLAPGIASTGKPAKPGTFALLRPAEMQTSSFTRSTAHLPANNCSVGAWAGSPQLTAQAGAATGSVATTRGLGEECSSWTTNGGLQHPGCCDSWVWQHTGGDGCVKQFAFFFSSPALVFCSQIFKEAILCYPLSPVSGLSPPSCPSQHTVRSGVISCP